METISSQLKALRKQIKIPWRVIFVKERVKPEDFEQNTVYVHIWI